MKTPQQSEAELRAAAEDFIAKLKSLQFAIGKALPPCPVCGKGIVEHKMVGFAVRIELRRDQQAREELAFSA